MVNWLWWKKNTGDPLLMLFLNKYNLHPLSVPRQRLDLGDIYILPNREPVPSAGNVKDLLIPPLQMPESSLDEIMADFSGRLTEAISYSVGVGFMESFLVAIGAGPLNVKLRSAYEGGGVKTLRFRFENVTRDSIAGIKLGNRLKDSQVDERNAIWDEDNRYYIVTGIARSASLSVLGELENKKAFDIEIGNAVAGLNSNVKVEKAADSAVTYKGNTKLAFGVELYELEYSSKTKKIKLAPPTQVPVVRGIGQIRTKDEAVPAMVRGPDNSPFLDLK